jgi:hypothetical protein
MMQGIWKSCKTVDPKFNRSYNTNIMKRREVIQLQVKRPKRRAIELFADTRFFEKKELSKKVYNRKQFGKPTLDE